MNIRPAQKSSWLLIFQFTLLSPRYENRPHAAAGFFEGILPDHRAAETLFANTAARTTRLIRSIEMGCDRPKRVMPFAFPFSSLTDFFQYTDFTENLWLLATFPACFLISQRSKPN
jgi:hypothetical protein